MLQSVKKSLKNQRGLTLIELLAVIVILGIIAAIAVPSITGILKNSEKDAQVANAQQMASAAKMAVASNDFDFTTANSATITLESLVSKGYLETFKNPDDKVNNYNTTTSLVLITKVTNGYTYTVTLVQGGTNGKVYINQIEAGSLKRTDVN